MTTTTTQSEGWALAQSQTFGNLASFQHPLEPLTPEEIKTAVSILKREKQLGKTIRFPNVTLKEPDKQAVFNFEEGDNIEREVFIILLDNADGATYEAVVSLTTETVTSWEHIPDVQPSIMLDEFEECEAAVKASPEFQEAIKKRGIEDPDLVMVDPWSAGYYGIESERGKRLSRALCWVRSSPTEALF